jgi:hypothetical protein
LPIHVDDGHAPGTKQEGQESKSARKFHRKRAKNQAPLIIEAETAAVPRRDCGGLQLASMDLISIEAEP